MQNAHTKQQAFLAIFELGSNKRHFAARLLNELRTQGEITEANAADIAHACGLTTAAREDVIGLALDNGLVRSTQLESHLCNIAGMRSVACLARCRLGARSLACTVQSARDYRRTNVIDAEQIGALYELGLMVRAGEVLPCVRVSSAQARGAAKRYPYWGVARYEVRYSARQRGPVVVAVSRARSERRSQRLAEHDAEATGLPVIEQVHGRITPRTAMWVLA